MVVLTMTSCHLNGQYVAMFEVAVVLLILQTHGLIAPQSPSSLSSSGTIIGRIHIRHATAPRADWVYLTEKGHHHGLTTFSRSYGF